MGLRRLKIGDVFEIPTRRGLAYAQLTFMHREPPKMGDLVRVFPGEYQFQPPNLSDVVNGQERFMTFVPMGSMLRHHMAKFVVNLPVPKSKRGFPTFRCFLGFPGEPGVWRQWDGTNDLYLGSKLTERQRQLPILATWSPGLLVERIESGWSHLDDIDGIQVPEGVPGWHRSTAKR